MWFHTIKKNLDVTLKNRRSQTNHSHPHPPGNEIFTSDAGLQPPEVHAQVHGLYVSVAYIICNHFLGY